MYKAASKDILNKISKIFPGAMLSDVNSQHESSSLKDLIEVIFLNIQRIVQRIPLPAEIETSTAILNMKSVVDSQELKIQKNMMEEDFGVKEEYAPEFLAVNEDAMETDNSP